MQLISYVLIFYLAVLLKWFINSNSSFVDFLGSLLLYTILLLYL